MLFTFPQTGTPTSFCICSYCGWNQAQILQVITRSLLQITLTWEGLENSSEGPLYHSVKEQRQLKKIAFSLVIYFGRLKLTLIMPNAS